MASIDGSLKSIIQGVSQQVPRERLDGQVSEQINMLSDPVKGMRRRPGMRLQATDVFPGAASTGSIFATSVDIEDSYIHVLVNTATGGLALYDASWTALHLSNQPYLVATDATKIHTATLRGQLYICNTDQKPVKHVDVSSRINPARTGFYYVLASAYSKKYNLYVTIDGTLYTGTYTAPTGSEVDAAVRSTPEYIATQLRLTLVANGLPNSVYTAVRGSYISFLAPEGSTLTVASDSGSTYVGISNQSHVALVSQLPASLPADANGFMIAVGADLSRAAWYTYKAEDNQWVETGDYNSASALVNMPMRIKLDSTYQVELPVYEGRLAGNDTTNEDPAFIVDGLTGMSAFQGRLVLLSGPTVVMSASGKPLRWYRSTVTELLVADPISIYSGAAASTNWTHAVQFNKDLLLFSKACQGVVPSGNAVLSPTTAQIVITSGYACTSKATPIVAGRSLLYYTPRSDGYAGVLEMVPSNTTDSQYTSHDITAHLPRYMPGVVRTATASTTSNSVALVCDGADTRLYIQEYLWSADEKSQSAWHYWTCPYPIACVWFVRDATFVGLVVNGSLCVASLEPQADFLVGGLYRPFSDLFSSVTLANGAATVPAHLRPAVLAGGALLLTYASGATAGERVGCSVNTATWQLQAVRNTPDGVYQLGLEFTSTLSPTPPAIRDRNGVVIGTGEATLIRYELTLRNVGAFHAKVLGSGRVLADLDLSGPRYEDAELDLDLPTYAESARVHVPVRWNSQESEVVLTTRGPHDMGVLTIEYVMQYHARRRRA
jgi:hypothetical protein